MPRAPHPRPDRGGVFGGPQTLATPLGVPRRLAVHPGGRIAVTTSATESVALVWDLGKPCCCRPSTPPSRPRGGVLARRPLARDRDHWHRRALGTRNRDGVAVQHARRYKSDVAVAWHPGGAMLGGAWTRRSRSGERTGEAGLGRVLANGLRCAAAFAPAVRSRHRARKRAGGAVDGADGSSVFALPGHARGVRAVAFSPDGCGATADEGGALIVWRTPDPSPEQELPRREESIAEAAGGGHPPRGDAHHLPGRSGAIRHLGSNRCSS